jgi:hypothetical protein
MASVALGLGRIGAHSVATVRGEKSASTSDNQSQAAGMPKSGYAELIARKDAALDIAHSAREVSQTLDKASQILEKASQEVKQVKNYPPYPPGNDQRVLFINNLNGLKQQIEALTVPPVQEGLEPVFYPRETGLDTLFPTASDEDVAGFGQAAEAARQAVQVGRTTLGAQLNGATGEILPESTLNDAGASELAGQTAGQLGEMPGVQLADRNYLARI